MIRIKIPFFSFVTLLMVLLSGPAYPNRLTLSSVGGDRNIGEYGTGIALNSELDSGLCYKDETTRSLKYALTQEDRWVVETVDRDANENRRDHIGSHCAILFDDLDQPHIVYYNTSTDELRHAVKVGGNWQIEVIDDDVRTDILTFGANRLSIAKDSAGHIGVAYYDGTSKDLVFAEKDGDHWILTALDEDGDVGRFPNLAYDSEDRPAIAYMFYENHNRASLKYIEHDGQDWQDPVTVDGTDYSGSYSSLVFDSQDVPHIAYQSYDGDGIQQLKYTNRIRGNWNQATTLNSGSARGASVGTFAQMVILNGNAHIIYRHYFFSALFGSVFYLKIHHLYFAEFHTPQEINTLQENITFSAAPRLNYSGLSLAGKENRLVYSAAIENFDDRRFSLYSGEVSSWSPRLEILSDQNLIAENDEVRLDWRDFDADSDAEIRFDSRENIDSDPIELGRPVSEDGDNSTTLDTSHLAPGEYHLEVLISDDGFQLYSLTRLSLRVPQRQNQQAQAPQQEPPQAQQPEQQQQQQPEAQAEPEQQGPQQQQEPQAEPAQAQPEQNQQEQNNPNLEPAQQPAVKNEPAAEPEQQPQVQGNPQNENQDPENDPVQISDPDSGSEAQEEIEEKNSPENNLQDNDSAPAGGGCSLMLAAGIPSDTPDPMVCLILFGIISLLILRRFTL